MVQLSNTPAGSLLLHIEAPLKFPKTSMVLHGEIFKPFSLPPASAEMRRDNAHRQRQAGKTATSIVQFPTLGSTASGEYD